MKAFGRSHLSPEFGAAWFKLDLFWTLIIIMKWDTDITDATAHSYTDKADFKKILSV